MNVRALPTCKKPVGDGANRTRSITFEYSKQTPGSWLTWTVPVAQLHRTFAAAALACLASGASLYFESLAATRGEPGAGQPRIAMIAENSDYEDHRPGTG